MWPVEVSTAEPDLDAPQVTAAPAPVLRGWRAALREIESPDDAGCPSRSG